MIKSCSTFLRVCITITTIIILAGITSEVSGQSEGLIAAYGFNTGTNPYIDSSGNSLSLTCSPSSCPTYTTTGGHDNSGGIDFSGAGDSLTIPSEHLFDFTNQMTVSFWMKNDRFDNLFESIVAKGTSSWAVGRYYYSRNATFYTTSQGAIHFSSPSFTVDNNAWHHIAVTYDGARKKIYVDGTLRSNQPYTRIIDQNNVAVTLGYNLQNNAYEYSGILDDVRIYNRALSATEITNDMNLPVGNVFPSATPSATSSPTLTFTPTSTFTPLPPTSTYTPLPTNTSTFTPLPPTSTFTPLPTNTSTFTPLPPTSTFTPLPPPSTFTPLPTTSTYTPIPTNTSTFTPLPPTSTFTSTPIPTFTNTALPPSPTYTPPPFNTPTITASPGVTTGPVQAGRQVAYTSTLADDRQYLLFLPNNYYTPPPGGWPVIMFFHGAGIGERWGVNGIRWEALPGMLGSRPDFPFIVISPRIYFSADLLGGSGWLNPTATNSMYVLLNEIQNSYQVNTNKTYLTGYSLGGGAVWNLGITYPEKFAALAPVGGFFQTHMSLTVPPNICDLYEKPIRSYHGTNDATINISLARGIIDAVNDCGAFDYAELIEGSWSHNNVDNSAYTANDDLYDWMLTHSIP